MTLSVANPIAGSVIRSRVRREVMDPDTWPSSQAKPAGLLRFNDTELLDAMNETLRFLQLTRNLSDPAPALYSVDVTYSSDPMNLPSSVTAADQVWKLEYLTTTSTSVIVDYVSHLEIEDHAAVFGTLRPFKFTLEAQPVTGVETGGHPALRLRVRPRPLSTGLFRLWYLEAPIMVGAATDTHDLFGRWQDLVVLMTAKNVLRRDDELTEQQQEDLAKWLALWAKSTTTNRGPQTIRRRRIGRS